MCSVIEEVYVIGESTVGILLQNGAYQSQFSNHSPYDDYAITEPMSFLYNQLLHTSGCRAVLGETIMRL